MNMRMVVGLIPKDSKQPRNIPKAIEDLNKCLVFFGGKLRKKVERSADFPARNLWL